MSTTTSSIGRYCCDLQCFEKPPKKVMCGRGGSCGECSRTGCMCHCKSYKALRNSKYCCDLKCFKRPGEEVDGRACRKCEAYCYCRCRCKSYMAIKNQNSRPSTEPVRYCCDLHCFEAPREEVDGPACRKCNAFGYCKCRCKSFQMEKHLDTSFDKDVKFESNTVRLACIDSFTKKPTVEKNVILLYARDVCTLQPGEIKSISTGVMFVFPPGKCGLIMTYPPTTFRVETSVVIGNTGTVCVMVRNPSDVSEERIDRKNAIAQMAITSVFKPILES